MVQRYPVCCVLLAVLFVCAATHAAPPTRNTSDSTTLYMELFGLTICYSDATAQNIQRRNTEIRLSAPDERILLYALLNKKGGKGRFDPHNVHVLLPAQDGKPEYQVDGEGVVRTASKEYVLMPSAFLRLSDLLSERHPSLSRNRAQNTLPAPPAGPNQ